MTLDTGMVVASLADIIEDVCFQNHAMVSVLGGLCYFWEGFRRVFPSSCNFFCGLWSTGAMSPSLCDGLLSRWQAYNGTARLHFPPVPFLAAGQA